MPWIVDPFADPLFEQLALRLMGLLGVAFIVLAGLALRSGQSLAGDILIKRWSTWVVISIVMLFGLLSGPLVFAVIVTAMVIQGLREYAGLVGLPPLYRNVLLALGGLSPAIAVLSTELFYLAVPLFLVLATVQPLRSYPANPHAVRDLALAVLGWGYIAWFLGHLLLIYLMAPGGPGFLVAIVSAVALSDVGAYTFGRIFGKRKLAPKISPNKTMAGAFGNFVGAYSAFALMYFALPQGLPKVLLLILPLIIGAGSIWGDLFESVVKREFGVKDAGDWLPGFGGLLDRIDSLILVSPIAYYAIRLLT